MATGQSVHYVSGGPDNMGLPTARPDRRSPVHDRRPRKPSGIDFDALAPICQACGERSGSVQFASMLCRGCQIWMLATFDPELGPDQARCHLMISDRCRGILDYATVTADRLDTGGGYTHENCSPACAPCQSLQGALVTHGQWPVGAA